MSAQQDSSRQAIQQALDTIEPDPKIAGRFAASDIEVLIDLFRAPVGDDDLERERASARALYALTKLLPSTELAPLLNEASRSPFHSLRRTAACATRDLPSVDAKQLLCCLLEDAELSVKRAAARSAPPQLRAELRLALEKARPSTSTPYFRRLIDEMLQQMPRGSGLAYWLKTKIRSRLDSMFHVKGWSMRSGSRSKLFPWNWRR